MRQLSKECCSFKKLSGCVRSVAALSSSPGCEAGSAGARSVSSIRGSPSSVGSPNPGFVCLKRLTYCMHLFARTHPGLPLSNTSISYTKTLSVMPATTSETLSLVSRQVSVAPLVLLSVADHYGRSAKGTRKRVVGVLLGQNDGKDVRVSNCFAGELNLGK